MREAELEGEEELQTTTVLADMPPLLSIQVPEGWRLDYHTLFDEDPEFIEGVCTNLTEDLLQLTRGPLIIDAGFYRDRYRVVLVREGDWDHPIRQRDCQDRWEVVALVEDWSRDEDIVD